MTEIQAPQLVLALIEGLGLILSPCILPILPIMLAASLDGGKARPLGIITGFIAAFTGFALLSRQILEWLHADPEIVRNVALGLLVIFGFVMLSKILSDKLLGATQGLANFGQNLTSRFDRRQGFFSGVAIGALIGLIWTPCAGPIMAAAVVQVIQARTNLEVALTVGMFALGAGVPMLLIALLGRQIMSRLSFLKTHSYAVRRVLGFVIIAAAVLIYEGADIELLAATGGNSSAVTAGNMLERALPNPYPAPEVRGIDDWVNSEPLKIANLKGKVVLIDFWTYSCINCVRTLPYITRWDTKYRDKGLVIIGVHSPEFAFEKKLDNVKMAVAKYGIHYPVALDSDLDTWESFGNHYWPAHYLIDKNGNVVYTHFGEGEYDVTEHNIRVLLGLGGEGEPIPEKTSASLLQTPETYLGYDRMKNFASGSVINDHAATYKCADPLLLNNWCINSGWLVADEYISSQLRRASLKINFIARKVFLVMAPTNGRPVYAQVLLNGAPIGKAGGADVKDSVVTVDQDALYELVDQGETKNGVLEIIPEELGLKAYAFTFGE